MYSRREIVPDNSYLHVFFRCHDKNMFLEPDVIKHKILELLAKYKSKYHIKIFDFIIMDNHVHLYLWAPNSHALGNFMRTVCSQIARKINQYFERDSQALRERYKSRLIMSSRNSFNLIKYIYRNRFAIDNLKPANEDYFCSAYWRIHKPHQKVDNPTCQMQILNNLLAKLLDDYTDPLLAYYAKDENFTLALVDQCIQDFVNRVDYMLFKNSHTIGSEDEIAYRVQILRSGRRYTGPPILEVGASALYPDVFSISKQSENIFEL